MRKERLIVSHQGIWSIIIIEGENKLFMPCDNREEAYKKIKSWGMNPESFKVKEVKEKWLLQELV